MVTDDHYNGNNSDKEVKDVNACQDKTKKLDVNSIMELCSNIQENYQFKYIQKYDCTERGKLLSAIVFEILPLQRYFTIETALEYQSRPNGWLKVDTRLNLNVRTETILIIKYGRQSSPCKMKRERWIPSH